MGPIADLPSELLLNIFMMVAVSFGFALREDEYEAGRSWLSITHTCQYWRTLAIASPLLWSTVEIQEWSLGLASTFLMRAANAPLQITVLDARDSPFSQESLHRISQLLLPRGRHIIRITAEFCSPSMGALASLLKQPAPMLAILDLRLHTDFEPMYVKDIFSEGLPSLRQLTTHGVVLPLSPQICSRLTVLCIFDPPDSLNIDSLTSLLGEASELRILKFSVFDRNEQVACSRPGRTVCLPNLQILDLQVPSAISHHFFLHFAFPSTAKMTIQVMGKGNVGASLLAQSDTVQSIRQNVVKADFAFSVKRRRRLTLDVVARDAAENKRFKVGYLWYVPARGPLDLSHVDPEIYSFSNLTALSIDIQSTEISPAQWASILSDLVRLTTMQVKSYDADLHLVQGLAMERPLDGGLLCPALVEMHIHGALCGKDRSDSTLLSALDALEHRALLGCPLSTLSMVTDAAGALSTEHLIRLRCVVTTVEQVVGT